MIDIFSIYQGYKWYKKNFSGELNIPGLLISVSDEDKKRIYELLDNYFFQTTHSSGGFDYVTDVVIPWATRNKGSYFYKLETLCQKYLDNYITLENEVRELVGGKKINPEGILPRSTILSHQRTIEQIVHKYENERSWLKDL